jgi:hypothetical protein
VGVRLGLRSGLLVSVAVAASMFCTLVGSRVVLHPGRGLIGSNPSDDFQIMAWSLHFWPWAVSHGLPLSRTSLLWTPSGFSTLWMTTIPGPALFGLPVTLTAGPIAAYNVLVVACVLLATAGAYLLCWELTEDVLASCVGGILFGLSPYALGHAMSQHLDLLVVFPLPLLGLTAVRYARRRTSTRSFAMQWAVLLIVLVSSSLELFLDATLLIAVVGLVGVVVRSELRPAFIRVARGAAIAYGACLPILAVVGYVGLSAPHGPVEHSASAFSTDLLNLIAPTPALLAGSIAWIGRLSSSFVGNIGEQDGYLGIPLLVICAAGLRARWRRLWPAALVLVLGVALSLGPIVAAHGHRLVSLPFSLAEAPVLGNALPARYSVFAFLAAVLIAAVWLSRQARRTVRLAAGGLIAASLFPNFWLAPIEPGAWSRPHAVAWSTAAAPAAFVKDRRWRILVRPGANVLVLPTGDRTAALWWQVESGMRFALAAPASPFVPPPLAADPTVARLTDNVLPQLDGLAAGAARLRSFLHARKVDAVIVTQGARRHWLPLVRRATSTRPVAVNGSLILRVPRHLPPLAADTPVPVHRSRVGRATTSQQALRVWLAFNGARGRVLARVGRAASDFVSSHGDATSASAADAGNARAAIAFVQWDGHVELLRVASHAGRGWHVDTLDRNAAPIWSQQVELTRDGTILAGWIDAAGTGRRLLFADKPPDRRWTKPIQLDAGDGLGSFSFRPLGAAAPITWRDSIAGETRVLSARFQNGAWNHPKVVARRPRHG